MKAWATVLTILILMAGCSWEKPVRLLFRSARKVEGKRVSYPGKPSLEVIEDAVERMSHTWPPAKVKLTIARRRDEFGRTLILQLREAGYAVHEHTPPPSREHPVDRMLEHGDEGVPSIPPSRGGRELSYELYGDGVDLILILHLGGVSSETLSRGYVLQEGAYKAVGEWAYGVSIHASDDATET